MGLEIARPVKRTIIPQRKFMLDMFKEYGFLRVELSSIPIEINVKFVYTKKILLEDLSTCMQLLGS